MAAPPWEKLATIWAVTSWGQADTPASSTPWSPAKTATSAGSGIGGGDVRLMAASWVPALSSRPSAPGGLVRRCCRAVASAPAAVSPGCTPARAASKRLPAIRSTHVVTASAMVRSDASA